MVHQHSKTTQTMGPNKTRHSPTHRYDPLRDTSVGNATTRRSSQSMAIGNLLNPLDDDEKWTDSRSSSSAASSQGNVLTPASSPETACGSTTGTPTWSTNSVDMTIRIPARDDRIGTSLISERTANFPIPEYDSLTTTTTKGSLTYTNFVNNLYKTEKNIDPSYRSSVDHPRRESASTTSDQSLVDDRRSEPRESRPTYTTEQDMWIWFHLTDLDLKWDDIVKRFHIQWPGENRKKGGLQCKAYRLFADHGLPKKRAQVQGPGNPVCHGMWPTMGRSYAWMDPYASRLQGYVPGGPYYEST